MTLKKELVDAESARKVAATDAQVYTRAAQQLKMMADQQLAQVTPLETQIGLFSKSLSLEQTTTAKDDFPRQTRKIKSECS
jgi:hypothetical protein